MTDVRELIESPLQTKRVKAKGRAERSKVIPIPATWRPVSANQRVRQIIMPRHSQSKPWPMGAEIASQVGRVISACSSIAVIGNAVRSDV